MRGNPFTEVVHDQSCKNLLGNMIRLFALELTQTDRILQVTETGFNAPAHMIQLFQFLRRKQIRIQIGDQRFRGRVRERKTDNTEGNGIKAVTFLGKKVEGNIRWKKVIFVRLLPKKSFYGICLFTGKKKVNRNIKFLCIVRERNP